MSTDEGAQGSSKPKKAQLAPAEMARFSFETALLSPPPAVGCMRHLEHAWGMGVGYGGHAVARYANRDFDVGRPESSDAGRSMVTDPEFAKSKCTGREQYVRELVAQPSAGAGGVLDQKQLREEYAALPPATSSSASSARSPAACARPAGSPRSRRAWSSRPARYRGT